MHVGVRAARSSPCPSTARDGTVSRIVHRLADGVVSTARADADLVVTEHGVADLRGATLDERVERLSPSPTPATDEDAQARNARAAPA